ncbi:MAG: M20/M25/M40 family metallo-hydrolase [Symbiobacteriaceae bacterium]|nr:M20/M25/M40 family metallo-hydrolase [Symbiobacteriaceae bacterium]
MPDLQRMLEEFQQLVRIDCATKDERLVVDALLAKLKSMGLHPEEDDTGEKIGGNAGNIFFTVPGNLDGPTVMFCAHTDRVLPGSGIQPQVLEDRVTSDGSTILAADDLAGVVQILEAIRLLEEEGIPHATVEILFTVSEESGLLGARHFDVTKSAADYAFFLDGGGSIGNLVVQAPYSGRITAKVLGRAAHAGGEPEKGLNAIVVAAHALVNMTLGRIDFETTANIGLINGGLATNIVPDTVVLQGESRSLQPAKLRAQLDHMVAAINDATAKFDTTAEITVTESNLGYALSSDEPIVKLACAATTAMGLTPNLIPTGGGSDANVIRSKGIPSMVIPNGLMNAHRLDEYVLFDDLTKGTELVLSIIKTALEFPKQPR